MDKLSELVKMSESDIVETAKGFAAKLHTHLVLGQSRYVCRYGTLSEGHEKVTDSQKYYQAHKEMYFIAQSITNHRVEGMLAQADLLEAKEALEKADTDAKKIRSQALIMRATDKITTAFIMVEDLMRQLDEYNKVRRELESKVEAQYPEGMEQAEADNWRAVAMYRTIKSPNDRMDNIPMPAIEKANLGAQIGRKDMIAALFIENESKARDFLEHKK